MEKESGLNTGATLPASLVDLITGAAETMMSGVVRIMVRAPVVTTGQENSPGLTSNLKGDLKRVNPRGESTVVLSRLQHCSNIINTTTLQ